jgi:predicted enzyme related to lactoylglutathione lyase
MTSGVRTVIFPVKDLAQAKSLFSGLLGVGPVMDEAYYVQFNVAGQEVGLDPGGHGKGMTGPGVYWQVEDIKESLRVLVEAGAQVHQEITDFGGGGRQVAAVKDADGNIIGLIQQA